MERLSQLVGGTKAGSSCRDRVGLLFSVLCMKWQKNIGFEEGDEGRDSEARTSSDRSCDQREKESTGLPGATLVCF